MFAWLNPIALVGVLGALGPIAVHLLRRQRANRLPFASVRFVRAASTAAVRLRLPTDIGLLLIRVAIVAAAAAALAQPLVITGARRASWDHLTSRAIVVDTSASMTPVSQRSAEAANAEAAAAARLVRVEAERLADGLDRAVDALADAPPSRREVVVISDFQQGALTAADIERVPLHVGLRFVNVGQLPASVDFHGDVLSSAPGVEARVQRVHATREGTTLRVAPARSTGAGLRLIGGPNGDALLRAVARAGAPAPSAEEPLALAFAATAPQTPAEPETRTDAAGPTTLPVWMLRTLVTMRRDPALTDAAREHSAPANPSATAGFVVARDASGHPAVVARAAGRELVLSVAGTPLDYLAAASLRSALIARRGERAWEEYETVPISEARLASWARDPAPPGTTGWQPHRNQAPGDARWVWLAVLMLLGLETIVRRRRRDREAAAYADAA